MPTPKVMCPTIHLNGTGKEALLMELEDAIHAVSIAVKALSDMTVHGRDYYVQSPDAIIKAVEEHRARMQALTTVLAELEWMYQCVSEQGK